MPFLLATPTILVSFPFMVAVNSVGVEPKSESFTSSLAGTCQELENERSEAFSFTIACAYGSDWEHEPALPVTKYNRPAASSIVGAPQTPFPVQPLGVVLKICWIAPVVAFNWIIWPCTRGQSPKEAMPT